jgi:hypothetical protein
VKEEMLVLTIGSKVRKKEENVNVIGLVKVMNKYLRGTEKSKLIYNYSALTY